MKENKEIPKFMMVYRCQKCGQESGMTELKEPVCFYCEEAKDPSDFVLVSQKPLTPEVMAERLKTVTDNMMKNLQLAFESRPDDDDVTGETGIDAEHELLKIMAMAKELKDKVQSLELRARGEEE
ncbi:MAG TPA: hypothetical protein VMZ69_01075 [Saprospiraceae bacterium]|nr:hypothetical protein [Saprospiraceae bacterium]